jgi:hypothetical protein
VSAYRFFLFFLSWCLIAVLTVDPLILSDEIKSACAASLARMIEFAIQYHSSDVLWIQAINAEATLVATPSSLPIQLPL